ncbi:MAG TPA: DUF2157 domain-containing protein [Bryobacteraceae bacterium]|jgi:uncharacterized membrane protein|nr:DUF2157 domain-containing protein [Bryobacteraceae bacterium]
MPREWEAHLEQWTGAGLLDPEVAGRIRAWERAQSPSRGLRWPVVLALVFGAILLAAGVLLFVSAHWDQISPGARMTLVVLMVAVFHAGGAAVSQRFDGLSIALHAVGTVTLGAAIALAGQIYNLSEHWPSAVLLWALGAALAWALLRQWPQAVLTALLVPAWLASEWSAWCTDAGRNYSLPVTVGICALSLTYLSIRRYPSDTPLRKALMWIGGLALLPSAGVLAFDGPGKSPADAASALAWAVALLLPLAIALLLRRRDVLWNIGAILWAALLGLSNLGVGSHGAVYLCCAIGSVGLAWWGMRESRPERINLAIAGFALTVICFYFSDVMDKLGRSFSLILLGLVFLGGGWLLERTRRGLLARIAPVEVK